MTDIAAAVARVRAEVERATEKDANYLILRRDDARTLRDFAAARLGEPPDEPALREEGAWWGELDPPIEGLDEPAPAEPKGCPTPGACSCPGYGSAPVEAPVCTCLPLPEPPNDNCPLHGEGAEPPADLVETVRQHIDYCLDHDYPEGVGGFRDWMAGRILTAMSGRILAPGCVSVPATCVSGHHWTAHYELRPGVRGRRCVECGAEDV